LTDRAKGDHVIDIDQVVMLPQGVSLVFVTASLKEREGIDTMKAAGSFSGNGLPTPALKYETQSVSASQKRLPVVAIGASAGGLDAFRKLLDGTAVPSEQHSSSFSISIRTTRTSS
jgi:chemotaxis response regulator CheB